jgi:hypothetical protein
MMGTPPEEIYLLNANLDVDETLYGSGAPSTLTIQTLQDVPPQPDWRETGNTVLAFMNEHGPGLSRALLPRERTVRLSRGRGRPPSDDNRG